MKALLLSGSSWLVPSAVLVFVAIFFLEESIMRKWLRFLPSSRSRRGPARRPSRCLLTLEPLEDRCLLSATVLQTNLVSDLPGVAAFQDPNLVNPWGIAENSTGPFWISDNNAGVSTLYNSAGTPLSLVVDIPAPGNPTGATGTPTGTVFNTSSGGFVINGFDGTGMTAASAPATFLFATEDGTIVGWNFGVNPAGIDPTTAGKHGIIAVDNSQNPDAANGAVYKGLTIATSASPIVATDPNSLSLLYVSNFRAGTIEVYNTNFQPVTLAAGAFTDANIPKGYAPFNVQVLNGKVYVTYAKQDAARHDDVSGPHRGFVDSFNLDGSGGQRLVTRGPLASPWGLAIAPSNFGNLSGALLVGNFGNGHINAFDASTGAFLDQLKDPDGEPIQIDDLWALKVGNGGNGGNANTVYFTAGIFDETHGLFGSLAPVDPGTPEGTAEAQMVTAAFDVVQIALQTLLTDIDSGAAQGTIKQDRKDLRTAERQFRHAERQFLNDAHQDDPMNMASVAALDSVFAEISKLGLA